jgi:hypothetical protein
VRTPQTRLQLKEADLLLLGTVPGFGPDGDRVAQAFAAFAPDCVALGVPPEDVQALQRLASADPRPELPELDDVSARLLELVGRFGPTAVPSPDLERANALAQGAGVTVASLDLDDATHSSLYTEHVKFRHVIQSNSIKRRLLKDGVDGADPYAVAEAWDVAWTRPKGLRRVETVREEHMADRLRVLAGRHRRILAVVPSVRLEAIVALLRPAVGAGSPAGSATASRPLARQA